MKRTICYAALLVVTLMLYAACTCAFAEELNGKDSLLAYIAENQYIGRWVSYALDYGNGNLKTKVGNLYVSKYLAMTIYGNGTLVLDVFGDTMAFELQKTEDGFRFFNQGRPNEIKMQGRLMIYKGTQYDTYLDQCDDPAGIWKAVSYTTEKGTFPSEMIFPDGCIANIGAYGYGTVTTNGEPTADLLMPYQYGRFDGDNIFFDPKWDLQKETFQLTYGKDTVITFARSMTENGDIPVEAVPPYYKDEMDGGNVQFLQMKLMRIAYPPEGWVNDMDQFRDWTDGCLLRYRYQDDKKFLNASISIQIYNNEALNYRDTLRTFQEIADSKSLEETQIGGIHFASVEYEDDGTHYRKYIGREPKANMNLYITISQSGDGLFNYQPILDSISFTLPVLSPSVMEPPLSEDSAPYVPNPQKVRVGDKEVTAAFLPMDTPVLIAQSAVNNLTLNGGDMLAIKGDTLYLLTGWRLYAMQLRGGRLYKSPVFPEGVWKMQDEYSRLSMACDGTLYVMDSLHTNFSIKDGKETIINEYLFNLSLHPSKEWGISFRGGNDTQVVDITENGLAFEKWALHDLDDPQKRTGRFDQIEDVFVSDDRIYVAGSEDAGQIYRVVSAYDLYGNELFVFGSEEWMHPRWMNITSDVAQTKNSVVILDTFSGALKVLSLSGEFIGAIDCDGMLGTKEAEVLSITPAEDGLILCAAQTRDDRSCTEVLVFHITGI